MQRKKEHDATLDLGVPVMLVDTVLEHDDGSEEIPDLNMLLATVAVARVLQPVQLVGAEVRFLRHVLDFTGTEFAETIGISDKSVVSRWENDKDRLGGSTEKIVRQLVLNLLGSSAPGIKSGQNAVPGMKIRPRELSEGPLPLSLRFGRPAGADGQSMECYAEAA